MNTTQTLNAPASPVPAPPKAKPASAFAPREDRPSPKRSAVGPWRRTKLARKQMSELGVDWLDIIQILEGAHLSRPARTGKGVNHYGNGLLILVDGDGRCIISVIESKKQVASEDAIAAAISDIIQKEV